MSRRVRFTSTQRPKKKHKQSVCLRRLLDARQGLTDDPFIFAYELTQLENRKLSNYINVTLNSDVSIQSALVRLRASIDASVRTKFTTYRSINPSYAVHNVYYNRGNIPEYIRVSFTRFRLSSHRLKVETGRWSRIAPERRVCVCGNGAVQNEAHVLQECGLTNNLREQLGRDVVFPDFIIDANCLDDFKFVYDVLKCYEM